jgi:hypothetical protein
MSRSKDDFEYVQIAERFNDVKNINDPLKSICEKVIKAGTSTGLTDVQRSVLYNAERGNVTNSLAEDQDIEDYVNYQMEKD